MEEKMKRESRKCLESLFRQNDKLGSGAITKEAMGNIIHAIIPDFDEEAQLEISLDQYLKTQRYTVLNPQSRLMEVKYQDASIDFPSALAIAVRFLKKVERRSSDAFAGKGLIRFTDLPRSDSLDCSAIDNKRRMY